MVMWNTWEDARRAVVTGTDAAAIAGPPHRIPCSYKTELQVWAHKAGYTLPFRADAGKLRMGNLLEGVVAQVYAHDLQRRLSDLANPSRFWRPETQLWLLPSTDGRERYFIAEPDSHFGGTPDFLIEPAGDAPAAGWGVLEVKTAGLNMLPKWQKGPPLGHRIQCMWYAGLLGLAWGAVAGLVGGQHLFLYEFAVDPAELAWLRARAARWWKRYVEGNEVPPTDAADLATVRDLYPTSGGGRVELPPEFEALWHRQEANRSQVYALDLEHDAAKARVLLAMGSAEEARVAGAAVGWTHYTSESEARTLRRKTWKT
jgi:predicted phage-related endonuclease